MTTNNSTNFAAEYLQTWTEPDDLRRAENIHSMWATNGKMAVSSLGITLEGIPAITAHIKDVHNDMIAGKKLQFSYDQEIQSGDATLLRWSMTAPNGEIVGRGVDTIFRNDAGKVITAYMFMGVD